MIILYDDDIDFALCTVVADAISIAVTTVEGVDSRSESQVARLMYPRSHTLLLGLMSQSGVG